MENKYLSFLMGSSGIQDSDLEALNIEIVDKDSDSDRKLKILAASLSAYLYLVRSGLNPGFWNEVIGEKEIIFTFKFKDGTIKEYILSPENEREIDKLCAEFNSEPPDKTANVYKYISDNKFYHDFMVEHYADMINRRPWKPFLLELLVLLVLVKQLFVNSSSYPTKIMNTSD